jgi:hypothetical protein
MSMPGRGRPSLGGDAMGRHPLAMRTIRASRLVAASRDRVWALYDDIANTPSWVPFSEEILYLSGPTGVGTIYRERTRLGGIADVGEWEITHHDPPRRQVHYSRDKRMDSTLIITMLEASDRTYLTQVVVLESRLPGVLGWLHERIVSIVGAKGIRSAVAAAKRQFEPAEALAFAA